MEFKGEDDFAALTSGSVVVDFYADWCGPCKRMSGVFANLVEAFKTSNIKFFKVDSDQHDMYMVKALPTILFLRDGEVMKRYEGLQRLETLSAQVVVTYGVSPDQSN